MADSGDWQGDISHRSRVQLSALSGRVEIERVSLVAVWAGVSTIRALDLVASHRPVAVPARVILGLAETVCDENSAASVLAIESSNLDGDSGSTVVDNDLPATLGDGEHGHEVPVVAILVDVPVLQEHRLSDECPLVVVTLE